MSQARKVLIVEDSEILSGNLCAWLQREGWDARVAATGEAAVAAANEFRPGVILLDYHLPDMKGFDALEAIRASYCCGCVLMTGHPADAVRAGADALRIGRIMPKPFPLAVVTTELSEAATAFCAKCVANGRPGRSGCGGLDLATALRDLGEFPPIPGTDRRAA